MKTLTSGMMPALALFLSTGVLAPSTGAAQATDDGDSHSSAIDTIVVTGTQTSIESARVEAAETPGGVAVIDMDAFRERNVSNLADVLLYAPGIWSASATGDDNIFFSSRGSNLDATNYDMNGIKLLQDGLPVTTADGNNHNRVVDPLAARYASVARGANAMAYGASTLGGAINFETMTARDLPGASLAVNGGSFGQMQMRLTGAAVFDDTFDGLVTVESKNWDGYREHNRQDRLGLYANGGWQLSDDVALRGYATWLSNDQELAGPLSRDQFDEDPDQAGAGATTGNYQVNVDTFRLAGKLTWQLAGNAQFEAGLSWEGQSLFHPIVDRVMVDFDGPGPMEPVEVFSLLIDTDQDNLGAVLRYRQSFGDHEMTVGANIGRSQVTGGNYRNFGGQRNGLTTRIDNSANSLEVFVMDRWRMTDHWTLTAALQAVRAQRDVRNTAVDSGVLSNPSATYTASNPRIGAIFDLTDDVALYGNVSRLFEPPTNYQLQDNVAGGDATLDAMSGTVLEIGTRGGGNFGADNDWGWDVSLYYAKIRDEILSVDDPEAPGTSLSTNIDQTVHAGLEALINANWHMGTGGVLKPLLSLTVNRFEFDNDRVYGINQLPAAPKFALRGEVIYQSERGWFAGPTFELVGERYADFANTYSVDSYTLLGLRGGWSDRGWTLYADLGNVLGEDYISYSAVRNVAPADASLLYPGAPRSVFVGVERRF
jgi:iron complex outermembrane receptor protein